MDTDHELLRAWHAGDEAAGNELLQRYFRPLYRFFSTKLEGDVNDLIQSTLLGCVKYSERVAAADSVRAYIYAIARNELRRRVRRDDDGPVDFGVSSMADLAPSPSSVAAKRERDRHLVAALRRITVDSQITLELHYWEDLSATELAAVLDVPVGTVKSRLRRAKSQLARELERSVAADARPDDDLEAWVESIRTLFSD